MPAIDYEDWARTYDDTRSASPSVLDPIIEALGPPAGRSLLDIGGGTGNFAAPLASAGFRIALLDPTSGMLRRADTKLSDSIGFALADAHHLPFRDAAFDCALSVNVLGHLADWRASLKEARRVIRDGPFVIKVSTRETLKANWVLEYMPRMLDHAPLHHYQPEEATLDALNAAGFSRIDVTRVHYKDAIDGSFQAPQALAGVLPQRRRDHEHRHLQARPNRSAQCRHRSHPPRLRLWPPARTHRKVRTARRSIRRRHRVRCSALTIVR